MSLVTCKACGQRMSHLSKQCPHCDDDGSPPIHDVGLQKKRRQLLDWRYRVRMTSYTAVTVIVTGVIIWWTQNGLLSRPESLPSTFMAIGTFIYFCARAGLFWIAIQLRKVRKAINAL